MKRPRRLTLAEKRAGLTQVSARIGKDRPALTIIQITDDQVLVEYMAKAYNAPDECKRLWVHATDVPRDAWERLGAAPSWATWSER